MRGKNNVVWGYFDKNEENKTAKCKTCGCVYKSDRTYNLKQHLHRVHNIALSNLENKAESDSPLPKIHKGIRNRRKIIKIEMTKKQLFRSYIGLVTEDGLSLNILNSENLRSIVDPICEGLSASDGKKLRLNASNCKKTIKTIAQNIRSAISTEVHNRLLSLKIDSATRLSRTVFGISVQFMSNNKIQSRLLGMTDLKGALATTSKRISAKILQTLDLYNISLKQIISITSDNGANMIKGSKLLAKALHHQENFDGEENNEIYLQNIYEYEQFDVSLITLGVLQHCRCAAHTAQLCALDVTKNEAVKKGLFQCRNFTKFLRKTSNGFRELFELKGLRVPGLDCATRWGSTYKMLEDLKNAKCIIQNVDSVTNRTEDENFEINSKLWDFIEDYVAIFAPLQKTIVKFQEEQLNYGDFYALWLKCKLVTKRILNNAPSKNNNEENFILSIGKCLLKSFEEREKKLLGNKGFNACLFLDPRFHHLSKRNEAEDYLIQLWEQLIKVCPTAQKSSEESRLASEPSSHDEENEDQILNDFLAIGSNRNEANDSQDIRSKLHRFRLEFTGCEVNILKFWAERKSTDPELYALSNICFAIPPTQVTVERAFSALKLVLSDLRNRLQPDFLEDILLVKLNKTFLDEAIDNLELFEEEN